MKTVTIEVPDETFFMLRRSPVEVAGEMRLAAAMIWYKEGRITQGTGAAIAGLSRREFIEALGRAGVDAIQIDAEELREEVECGLRSHRECVSADLPDAGGTA